MPTQQAAQAANIILDEDRAERRVDHLAPLRNALGPGCLSGRRRPSPATTGHRADASDAIEARVEDAARRAVANQIEAMTQRMLGDRKLIVRAVYADWSSPRYAPCVWPLAEKTVSEILADCAAAIAKERAGARFTSWSSFRLTDLLSAETALVAIMVEG